MFACPQVHPSHPPGGVEMRIRPFQSFAASTQQPFAARPANPTAVPIDRVPGLDLARALPVPSTAIGFRDVGAHTDRLVIHERLVAVSET